jgi:CHAD domain-containing protein
MPRERKRMEVEAKFRVPNREVYRDMLRLRQLGAFAIAPVGRVRVEDRYFDTADGRLLAGGYSCRLRTQAGAVVATLKGLGDSAGAVHRRDEREIALPRLVLDPAGWPDSPARELALQLTDGARLEPLFDLHQSRCKSDLMQGARRVAEWSLDEVRAVVGKRPAFYYELEVELGPDGTDADLEAVATTLQEQLELEPEHRSKFIRGRETLRIRGAAIENGLSDEERAAIEGYARGADAELARRAATVLAWADDLPTREIVARTGLSAGRVRFWLRAFRGQRMGIFEGGEAGPEGDGTASAVKPSLAAIAPTPAEPQAPAQAPEAKAASQTVAPAVDAPERARHGKGRNRTASAPRDETVGVLEAAPASDGQVAASDPEQPAENKLKRSETKDKKGGLPTVLEFCRDHGADMPRARWVAGNMGRLFDGLRKIHGLPKKRGKLAGVAALLAGVGAETDPEDPARAGRDLILAQPLRDVSTGDRLQLACIVALQREKMKPNKEPALEALEPKERKEAIVLAALLQMATGLSGAGNGAPGAKIASIDCGEDGCDVTVEGPSAEADAALANRRARYWRDLFKHDLRFAAAPVPAMAVVPAEPKAAAEAAEPEAPAASETPTGRAIPELPPLQTDDPMAEAGRKVMFTHFMKMLANEAGTREGADIEFLHDMRVSTRRLRAAFLIFEPFYEEEAIGQFNKDMRRAGRTLGAVRDLDVLIEKAEEWAAVAADMDQGAEQPEAGLTIQPLLDHWAAQREVARREMLAFLDGPRYQRFVEGFQIFLLSPGAGAKAVPAGEPVAHQVRHVIPRLIMERYEQVRAYEPIIGSAPLTTYHMLRIDCKRLRYALEFIQKLLGPEAPGVIKQVTAMQELLGAMQDAHVAEGVIGEFLTQEAGRKKRKGAAIAHPGVEAYLQMQRQVQQDLLVGFAPLWARLTGLDFRRALGAALATP